MVCKQCGLETNVDGAVFCSACGARLDGKTACPHCSGLNDPASAFCAYCGKRIDGKTVCSSCGAAFEGAFCSQCGAPANGKAVKVKAVKEKKEKGWWNPLLKWFGAGSAILAATFAFIFLFLIGTETIASPLLGSLVGSSTSSSTGIFDYFGSVYADIETSMSALEGMEYESEQIVNLYIAAGLGTLISAATIVCVTTFFILAVIKFVRFATGKADATGLKFAMITVLAYLGGAAGIYAINGMVAEISVAYSGVSVDMEMGEVLNGATSAGIVLSLIFLLLSAATALVAHGKEWIKPAVIKKNAFIVGGLVFALIFFFMWQSMAISTDFQTVEGEYEIFASPLANSSMFLSMVETLDGRLSGMVTVSCDEEIAFVYIGDIVAQLLMLGGIACAAGLVSSRIRQIGGKKGTGMGWSIATLALSASALVAFVLVKVNMESVLDAYMQALNLGGTSISSLSSRYEISVGGAIGAVVLSAIGLAICIVQKILCKDKEETPAKTPTAEIE